MEAKANDLYEQILELLCTEIIYHAEAENSINLMVNYTPNKLSDKSDDYNIFSISVSKVSKEMYECSCPQCNRSVGALRFAPHLEKCLGMGRVSSRIASRRLASTSSGKDAKLSMDDTDSLSSQNDAEWTMPRASRRSFRKKKERPKRLKSKKIDDIHKLGGIPLTDDIKYSNMSLDGKHNVLDHVCGVISEHTGRLCSRSMRCPKHTDEQRNNVRLTVLGCEEINADLKNMNVCETPKYIQDIAENKEYEIKNSEDVELPVVVATKRLDRHQKLKS